MGKRCSNGRLFTFGMANEGRLGIPYDEQTHAAQSFNKTSEVVLKGIQLVHFET